MLTNNDFVYDVFISYSHKNSDWARNVLLRRLEENGLKVCVDYRDFRIGAPNVKEMERSVINSRKTIVVLTPEYLASDWTAFEVLMMQTLDPINRNLRLVPILKTNCDLPLSVSMLNYVNFAGDDDEEFQWQRLLEAVKRPVQILLVDDEADVRTTIGGLLEDTGYSVSLAANESEASLLKGDKEFDFLVVDVGLQGGLDYDESGLKLAQDFRKHCPQMQIIILTGKGFVLSGKGAKQLIIRAFRDIGVNDFIEKDPDMGIRLLASIQRLLVNIRLEMGANANKRLVDKPNPASKTLPEEAMDSDLQSSDNPGASAAVSSQKVVINISGDVSGSITVGDGNRAKSVLETTGKKEAEAPAGAVSERTE